jgi:DNA-binding CsgD family transcriptional regulator
MDAYTLLSKVDQEGNTLDPQDLKLLAEAAYLVGKSDECTNNWNRAHHAFLKQDNTQQAARCAFWLGMILLNRGNSAQGGGWIARAGRLVEDYRHDCVEEGFLLVPKGLQSLGAGNHQKAHELFSQAIEIGSRFNNPDLVTLGRLGCGQALVLQNKIDEGTTLFDEVMVVVLSDEISPIVTGIAYCAVIETCQKIYDLGRAREWTGALSSWCDSHPDLVPFRGQCLVRRVEIMQLHGEWQDAMDEVERACELLSQPPGEPAAGEAYYRQGELFRLLGKFSKAEKMYRRASKWGRKPQPGLALLRLAQGEIKDATAAIRQSEEEKKKPIGRSGILPAYVVIMLAADEIQAAQGAVEELSEIADELQAPYLQAVAARSQGNVLFEGGDLRTALEKLRHAWSIFKNMDASYESAKTRVLIGRACREIGDKDTAEMELDAARWTFKRLSAAHDLEIVESLIRETPSGKTHGLTPRELEVLQLLATGKTNKAIATDLFISERTVDRHVSNILSKLDVSSRSAATAYAYKHNLV